MALTQKQVSELYVAIFNRASEGEGNKFWQTSQTGAAAANAMLATADAKTYFGTSLNSNQAFIEHIYSNTLNKTYAQDKAGIDFWVNALNSGMSRGEVVASLVAAVANYSSSTDPVTKAAYDQFNNRVEVSNYMANTVEKAPADYATSTKFATSGTTGLVVTNSASTVTTAKTSVDTLKPVDGTTFTLTTGVDTFTGSDKDDLFKGSVSTLTSDNTLNPTDTLDGGAGIDTLKVNVNSDFTGFTTGSLKNVENIELTNVSSVARSFDATGITGATKYTINANNNAGVNLVDLDKTVDVSVSNIKDTATFTTAFNASAKELTGTSDAMNLAISSLGVVDDAATTVNEEKVVNVTLNSIETANVSATNSNVISFTGTDLKALNISGAGNVKVNTVTISLTSVDASASTGAIDIDTTATTSTLTSVKTGSGNDKVKLNTADILANGTISLGAGEDTLTLASGATTVQYTLSGAETLALDGVTSALVFSGANVSGLTTVSTVAANNAATSLVNMGTQALTVDNKGATVETGDLSSDHAGATTLNYKADAASVTTKTAQTSAADYTFDNSAAALTVNVNEYTNTTGSDISAAKATSVTLNVASGKSAASTPAEVTTFNGTITAAKATSVTVNAEGALGAASRITAAEAKTATITNGATAGTLQYVGAKTTDLTLKSGSTSFTFATGTDLSAVQNASFTMDKGALSFAIPANGNLAKASSVTLAGADTTSAITLGNLGAITNDYGLTLTASGLKAGLTVGNLDVNTGYDINAVVAGVKGATSIAAGGNIGTAAKAKNITVDAQNVGGTLALGAITGTGAVTVKLDGTSGAVTLGAITGKTVNLDASDTIGGVVTNTYTVNATDSATIAVSSLLTSTVNIDANATSTALTVALTGGIAADVIDIDTVATSTSVVVTGDLGLGTDTVNLADVTYATTAMTKDISGLLNYETAIITGNSAKDTLKGGAGVDTITGGTGVDTMTGGAAADIFVFGALDAIAGTELDVITDFNAGGTADKLQFTGAAPTVLAAGGTAVAGVSVTTTAGGKIGFAAADNTYALKVAAIQADTLLDAANSIAFFEDSGNTYVYHAGIAIVNADDQIIQLTGHQH